MDKRDKYILIAVLMVVAVVAYLIVPRGGGDTVEVHSDPDFAASVIGSDKVIIRLYMPFTNMTPVSSAVTYAEMALLAAGKEVIVQTVEGNQCIRASFAVDVNSERGYDSNSVNLPTADCLAESAVIPTIELRQGTRDVIKQDTLLTRIEGYPEHMPAMMRLVLTKIYPEADIVVQRMQAIVKPR